MKTIIAPVDFSDVSFNAARYAARLAIDINAELILFHVAELPFSVSEVPVTEPLFEEINMENEMQQLKNELDQELQGKIKIITKNVVGSVEYDLKEFCNEKKPFAVVMSSHSSALLDKFFIGSVTVYAVTHLHSPVIIVPANAPYKPIKKIALAADLKEIYDVPIMEMEHIIKTFNASLDVIHVSKNKQQKNAFAVSGLLLDHRLQRFNPELYYVEHPSIQEGVSVTASEKAIDMIMIIPKKHSPFHHSQSKEFVFHSSLPVMSIHENDNINSEKHDDNHVHTVSVS